MDRELKQKILKIESTREVDADISDIVDLDEGEPELLEETFPHEEVPQMIFASNAFEEIDGELVEFDFAQRKQRDLVISDTTFRDGQQARPPYSKNQILDLYKLMGRLGGPNRVVDNTEFFLYSDSDIEAVEACLEAYADDPTLPEPTPWIPKQSRESS